MHDLLTIIICTRDRAAQLEKCVQALLNQTVSRDRFGILIVDNDSTDSTPDWITSHATMHTNIDAILEKRVGLSHARNTGFEASSSEWVAYLDDDAIPHLDWAEKMLHRIESGDFDGIGGYYGPYFDAAPPAWYLNRYNSNQWMLRGDTHCYSISAMNPKFSGGNCAFRRSVLVELGGFSHELGMRDGRGGYGEEIELQDRMLEAGYRLGFDADIRMDHHTPGHKQKLAWFITRSFYNGRDMARADAARFACSWRQLLHTLLRGGIRVVRSQLRAIRTSCRHLADGTYRWQNVLIECSDPLASYLGRLYAVFAGLRSRRRNDDIR